MKQLRRMVQDAYSAAAEAPAGPHAFPVGRDFAASLGYPVAGLPSISVEAFSGVSNISVTAAIPEGATVLDLGCGAGLDSLVAAQRSGPRGRVVGLDFSAAMVSRAHTAAAEARAAQALFARADAERLPLRDDSIDVAMVNGIFNLNPERELIFRELARVLRRGGEVYAAELVLREPLHMAGLTEADWFA